MHESVFETVMSVPMNKGYEKSLKKVLKMRDFKNNLSPELRDTEYTNGLRCSKGEIRYIVSNGDI
jgi:hypothetical protein